MFICTINILSGCTQPVFSQEDDAKPRTKKNKLQVGLYAGSYFANKHTARLYDGYGYDSEGIRNTFINDNNIEQSSFMYRRIVLENGGYNLGQTDQVATALGINHGEWAFDQTDMPLNMKYNPAFVAGLHVNYAITQKDAFLLNVNVSKLNLIGNFSIVITTPPIGNTQPGDKNIKTFAITGEEQRQLFQIGYQRILGGDDIFNVFVEAGTSLNITKYLRNDISINTLHLDLSTYYYQPGYPAFRAKYLRGSGLGAFAGFGLSINANQNWNVQLLYSPSYEKINIGEAPKFKIQNAVGLRALYKI